MAVLMYGTKYDEYRKATGLAPAPIVATEPTGKGWGVADKIFGYLDKSGEIYNDIRYPKVGEAGYDAYAAEQRRLQAGMFGLPQGVGAILLVVVIGALAVGLYKIAN